MSASGRIRVLVIDDSAFSRRTIIRMLERSPLVEVGAWARNGEEALRMALEEPFDLITLDLQMPRMDGFTFLRLLMARRPTPVLVISGRAREQDVFPLIAVEVVTPGDAVAPEPFPGFKLDHGWMAATRAIVPEANLAEDADWSREYLDLVLSIRVVPDLAAAIEHINHYGSGHTDTIVTQNLSSARNFTQRVDSSTAARIALSAYCT